MIFRHYGPDGQTLLPRIESTTSTNPPPAMASFTPGTTFGWKIDGHHSLASFNVPNSNNDGGHAMRFYAAKDRDGKPVRMSQTATEAKTKLKDLDPERAKEIVEPEPESPF